MRYASTKSKYKSRKKRPQSSVSSWRSLFEMSRRRSKVRSLWRDASVRSTRRGNAHTANIRTWSNTASMVAASSVSGAAAVLAAAAGRPSMSSPERHSHGCEKPQEWSRYASLMAKRFVSIDTIRETGINISRLTAWRWRHRLLKMQAAQQPEKLSGVIEADETFFRSSYKGSRGWKRGEPPENRPPRYRGGAALKRGLSDEQIPVLSAIAVDGGAIEAVLPDRKAIEPALGGRIGPGSVLCSDGHRAYVNVAVAAGSEHRRIKTPQPNWIQKVKGGKPRRKGRLGLGRVNAHHERMKTLVNREARGVSTRYLHLYVGWLRASRRPGFCSESLLSDALSTSK